MNTVWRYRLEITGEDESFEMPSGAKVVAVAMQDDAICFWAICNPEAEYEKRIFRIFGTGHLLPRKYSYIGSAFPLPYVWHVFEKAEE